LGVVVPRDLVNRVAVGERLHAAVLAQALVERAAIAVLLEEQRAQALAGEAGDAEHGLHLFIVASPAAAAGTGKRRRVHEWAVVEVDLAAWQDRFDDAAEREVADEVDAVELVEVVVDVVIAGAGSAVRAVAVRDDRACRLVRELNVLELVAGGGRLVDELHDLGELAGAVGAVVLGSGPAKAVVLGVPGDTTKTPTDNDEPKR